MRVLHVLPTAQARGAQVYARLLADELGSPTDRHSIATLFTSPGGDAVRVEHPATAPAGRLRRVWVDPRGVWRVRHLVHEERPDVVVCHGLDTLKYASLIARRKRPALLALAIGTNGARTGPRRRLYAALLRRASLVGAVSSDVAVDLEALYGISAVLLRNGRDVRGRPAHRPDVLATPVVAFVGQLTKGKRPELFIEVVRRLRGRGVDLAAVMIGDGPRTAGVRAAAREAGVSMLGRREDVAQLLAESDVLLFTSRPEGEGLPGVLIEAALAALPIVATDVPGVADVVLHDVSGTICAVGDVEAFVDAAERLLRDGQLRERWGRAARQHAEEHLSLSATLPAWSHALSRVHEGPAHRPRQRRTVHPRGR